MRFLELIDRSGLVDPLRLLNELNQVPNFQPDNDPKTWANHLIANGYLTRWQCDMLLSGKYKGFHYRSYKILDFVGFGSRTNTYLAEHVQLKQMVAFKPAPPRYLENARTLIEQVRSIARIEHTNLVRYLDVFEEGSAWFFVREYVPGVNLFELVVDSEPLPLPLITSIIGQLVLPVQSAHLKGHVFGNLNPGNVVLRQDGIVKVLTAGFGAADFKWFNSASEFWIQSEIPFFAPECRQEVVECDPFIDAYSIGAILSFLLNGKLSPMSRHSEPTSLARDNSSPDWRVLHKLCMQMTEFHRDERSTLTMAAAILLQLATRLHSASDLPE